MAGGWEHIVRSFDFVHALVFNQEKFHIGQPRTIFPSRFGDYTGTLGGQINRKCCAALPAASRKKLHRGSLVITCILIS